MPMTRKGSKQCPPSTDICLLDNLPEETGEGRPLFLNESHIKLEHYFYECTKWAQLMGAASNEAVSLSHTRLDVLDMILDIRPPPINVRKDTRSWFAF